MSLRCWGVRGSIPTPGPETSRFGGNTSCVELRMGDRNLIFDAGTGLRLLGSQMTGEESTLHAHILLTHFHWDHIQGFPFFAPLYDPRFHLTIVGPRQEDLDIRMLFARQMEPVYFPIPFSAVAATTSFIHLNEGKLEEDGFQVTGLRMRHPSYTLGYRVEVAGKSVCYLPDNELEGGSYPVDGTDWRLGLERFIEGADLLIHDAMYTDEESPARLGWGHSTFRQAYDLAVAGGVRHLLFFHHAPERTDEDLRRIVDSFRDRSERSGGPRVDAAAEGLDVSIQEG